MKIPTKEQDNTRPDPTETKGVEVDEPKNNLNVPDQDVTEDIIVKEFVNRASSLNWSDIVG